MSNYCVVVAAGKHAHLYTLDPNDHIETQYGPNLTHYADMASDELELKGNELWSDNKSGRNRAPNGSGAHGYDDHRAKHTDEYEKRFARTIAEQAMRLAEKQKTRRMILVAHNQTLGHLRHAMDPLTKNGLQIHELPKDLSKLSIQDLHEHLAKESLLPKRKRLVS